MMPPPPAPMRHKVNDQYTVPKPKKIRDVPKYVVTVTKAFFERLTYIVRLVWEASRFVLFFMTFMAVFNGVMPVIGSLIGKEILNKLALAYTGELTDFGIITYLLVFQFAYMFVSGVVDYINSTIIRIAGELISNHIKLKLMKKAQEIDVASFDMPDFHAKMENANREASMRPVSVLSSIFTVISAIISIISYIIVLAAVSSWAPVIIIVMSIPTTIISFVYRRKYAQYMFHRSKDRRQMRYYSDVIVNKDLVKEMRIFGLTESFYDKYKKVFERYYAGLKKLIFHECFWFVGMTVLTTAANCLLYIFIARGVFLHEYEVGNYSLYTGALTAVATGVSKLITTTASIYEGTLFINNMMAFMSEKRHIVPTLTPARKVIRHTAHTIVFDHVSFRYPGTHTDVINDVNLTIKGGSTVVLVGLNGAGKTTLIKLLTRLYDPTEGRILLDGHDIREYDIDELYEMFGIIFQDFGKYAVSVRENIAFGEIHKSTSASDVITAAQRANASDFINSLPAKYDTALTRYFEDDGTELSIGQWQKLSVARAFYSDSDVLILDEPTASLDPLAETEIYKEFDRLRKDKTSVFVSHRLSSATTADTVVVLENGRVIEQGSHSELMAEGGRYCELFTLQAQRYITPRDTVVH